MFKPKLKIELRRFKQLLCHHDFVISKIQRGFDGQCRVELCFCPKCGLESWKVVRPEGEE